jgi:hypothetical protein
MSELDEIELHDGLIRGVNIDFEAGSVAIYLAYYSSPDSRERAAAALFFEGVESISQILSVTGVRQNASAGNINYWVPSDGGGVTYIYVVNGCIAVTAKSVRFDVGVVGP